MEQAYFTAGNGKTLMDFVGRTVEQNPRGRRRTKRSGVFRWHLRALGPRESRYGTHFAVRRRVEMRCIGTPTPLAPY